METAEDCAPLQLHCVDRLQWRYDVSRPLILLADRTPKQRAAEPQTHLDTGRDRLRRFHRPGLRGLVPDEVAIVPKGNTTRVPQAVVDELARLTARYSGFQYRALVRSMFCTVGDRMHHQTVKKRWQDSPEAVQGALAVGDSHSHAEPYQARVQGIKRSDHGGTKRRIRHVLHVSRPTVDRGIRRFETAQFAGLEDQSRAPKTPARKVW